MAGRVITPYFFLHIKIAQKKSELVKPCLSGCMCAYDDNYRDQNQSGGECPDMVGVMNPLTDHEYTGGRE